MTLYLDGSSLLKRYFAKPGSDVAERYLSAAGGQRLSRRRSVSLQMTFAMAIPSSSTSKPACLASQIAEVSLLRTLDALHLAALRRVGSDIPLLSFDIGQTQAARALGITVLGA
jgi:hypothetical protein